jgi:hypothetical protein
VKIKQGFKITLLLIGLALYVSLFLINFTQAVPAGAGVTNYSTETYIVGPQSRQDHGGTITTITLSANQQDSAWKAYVGNISGKMVLKNTAGWSIYEWTMNSSSLTGTVFVTRAGTVTWTSIKCANTTSVDSEQAFFGMNPNANDNINKTFNYTTHKGMTISGVGTITASTCPSTATYVNGTAQTITETSYFQEILLTDTTNLVYGTFINKNALGYNNNLTENTTHDFQLLVAENGSSAIGTVYYFYADLSG